MPVLDQSVSIYRYFEEISSIPRGSGNEAGIARYLVEFAKAHKLAYVRDDLNNVVIYKNASAGRENEAPIMLQGHIDMVCEKIVGCNHDFLKDPIQLIVEDGWVKANGTTLGADDGAGVAYMLSVLDDNTLSHPPLECVFTANEETGMDGARGLKKDVITAKRMVGLDGGGETCTCVSSSGGRRLVAKCPVVYEENTAPCYLLTITGLNGGHSGACIDQGLGNSIKLGFRMLYQLLERGVDIRIVRITGGAKNNAIPREFAVLFASGFASPMLERYVDDIAADFKEELIEVDPKLNIALEAAERVDSAITQPDSGALITMGYLLPDGMVRQSKKLNVPTVSLNLGVLTQQDDCIDFDYLLRSPVRSARDELARQVEAISSIFGGYIQTINDYDGWNFTESSPLRESLRQVLKEQGQDMAEFATHGGLETGVFKGRYPKMDIVTYGPIAFGCHTPEEKLDLDSFRRGYENIVRLLEIV